MTIARLPPRDACRQQTLPDRPDALDCFQPPGSDRLDELLVVLLVLVGVALGEVGDRPVERVAVAQVLGDRDRVPGPGVGPRQRPPADAGVEREPEPGSSPRPSTEPFMSRSWRQ